MKNSRLIFCVLKNLYFWALLESLVDFALQETSYLLRTRQLPPGYLALFVGGKQFLLSLPFPIFDLVHVQLVPLLVSVQMNSYLPKQLLPGN